MRYLIRRLAFYVVALWASVTINFALPRLIPGNPVDAYIARLQGQVALSPATIQALEDQFGGSDAHSPILVQYFHYLSNILHGNLGTAFSQGALPVTIVLAHALPWTLGLVGVSTIISFMLGTLLGIVAAWNRGSALDSIAVPVTTFLSSIPYFWLALGLIYIFATNLAWLPGGYGFDPYNIDFMDLQGFSWEYVGSVLQHAILPALTIVISSFSGWLLGIRNSMLTTISEDYVLMARAKGLSNQRVMLMYAARNAILPSVTGFSLALGYVVAGSLLTEMVFSYPGIGFVLYKAISYLDYNLIEGIFLCIAVTILLATLLSEIAYLFLDPRVRHERG
ncbi:peptide ABC transporter permease [Ktedonobacteria bacterium brp13]|nr:peptide ABC transporter permease [Ktedonobacteria bacterium brp13]